LAAIAIALVIASYLVPGFLYDSGRRHLFLRVGRHEGNLGLRSGSGWGSGQRRTWQSGSQSLAPGVWGCFSPCLLVELINLRTGTVRCLSTTTETVSRLQTKCGLGVFP